MLDLNNINAGYDDYKVLKDITFNLSKGENLSIIGPNGCGKTTLLRVISNLIPFKGQVILNGMRIEKIKRKDIAKKIALMTQMTGVYFNYTVYDTIMMGRYVFKRGNIFSKNNKEDSEKVEQALKNVHMEDYRNRDIGTLSGGQLQRVFLAKVLAQEPDIILLDEPTNHLDLSYQVELIDFLKDWSHKNNKSVIGVLHDINLAIELSDKIMLLHEGRVKYIGTSKELLSSNCLKEAFNMDVNSYMENSLKKWQESCN